MSSKIIVIPVDGSQQSEKVFDWFVENMYKEDEDSLILLHCIEMKLPCSEKKMTEEEFKQWVEDHDADKRKLDEKFTGKTKNLKLRTCKFEFKNNHHNIGETICNEAKCVNADLIVMGSRGNGLIRRTILGSVSDYVLHHSHVPVIIIPSH